MRPAGFAASRCFGVVGCLCLVLAAACSSNGVDRSAGPASATSVPGAPESDRSARADGDRPLVVADRSDRAEPRTVIPDFDRANPLFYDVFGERYFVLESGEGYAERGIASWYGEDFHGLPTSGGEPYDMYAMTAAHRTLPIPTWVEVTNLANGKRIVVKVNDRGPFVDNRLIDLSFRAAEYLGMVEAGTTMVEVRALGVWNAGPEAPAVPASADSEAQRLGGGVSTIGEAVAATPGPNARAFRQIYIQVGAFAERANADQLADRLKRSGFDNSFVVTVDEGTGATHRVHIGPLDDADHTDEVNAGLRSIGINESRLVFSY